MTTDYERGRLAGFAEGVEAAREAAQTAIRVWATGTGTRVHEVVDGAIRALRAPSPAAERGPRCACGSAGDGCGDCPSCGHRMGWRVTCPVCSLPETPAPSPEEPRSPEEVLALCSRGQQWCHLCERWECCDNTNPKRPSPKEDAPRCLVCGGAGHGTVFAMDGNCPACGGTGRSTAGGGR